MQIQYNANMADDQWLLYRLSHISDLRSLKGIQVNASRSLFLRKICIPKEIIAYRKNKTGSSMAPTVKGQSHIMFLPFMAPGHMMPMVDMARLLSAKGLRITIITTTSNAAIIGKSISGDIEMGRAISFASLSFPWEEAGLPDGCENLTDASTPEMTMKLILGIEMLQPRIKQIFVKGKPDAIVSDYLFPWTVDVANELGIPRFAFSGSSFFNLCVSHCVEVYRPHDTVSSESEAFLVPGLPHPISLTRSQLPDLVKSQTHFSDLFEKLKEAERMSFGVLMNSFYELEPEYARHYSKVKEIRAWKLGPASLFSREGHDIKNRGGICGASEDDCMIWLDERQPKSVIYACFGSLVRFSRNQIAEIAKAFEDSGRRFVWVLGKVIECDTWWLPEGFEERARASGQGIIIKGWAPQRMILNHWAIGGFLTHCGWNSILEGVCAGVPLLTWPVFAEQFYNEKLVTQVIKVGVPVGSQIWRVWATEDAPVISHRKIEDAVGAVMGDSEKVLEMRRKATQLSQLANNAVMPGGSSSNDLNSFIRTINVLKLARMRSRDLPLNCSEDLDKYFKELTIS